MFCKARRIPYALENEVNLELEQLEQKGIIKKASAAEIENCSPAVWVRTKFVSSWPESKVWERDSH